MKNQKNKNCYPSQQRWIEKKTNHTTPIQCINLMTLNPANETKEQKAYLSKAKKTRPITMIVLSNQTITCLKLQITLLQEQSFQPTSETTTAPQNHPTGWHGLISKERKLN
jgi:hypothetical protein